MPEVSDFAQSRRELNGKPLILAKDGPLSALNLREDDVLAFADRPLSPLQLPTTTTKIVVAGSEREAAPPAPPPWTRPLEASWSSSSSSPPLQADRAASAATLVGA